MMEELYVAEAQAMGQLMERRQSLAADSCQTALLCSALSACGGGAWGAVSTCNDLHKPTVQQLALEPFRHAAEQADCWDALVPQQMQAPPDLRLRLHGRTASMTMMR
jgi:hypothetical protein